MPEEHIVSNSNEPFQVSESVWPCHPSGQQETAANELAVVPQYRAGPRGPKMPLMRKNWLRREEKPSGRAKATNSPRLEVEIRDRLRLTTCGPVERLIIRHFQRWRTSVGATSRTQRLSIHLWLACVTLPTPALTLLLHQKLSLFLFFNPPKIIDVLKWGKKLATN